MAKKIYLAPSNQGANRYAYGGTNEGKECQDIANRLKNLLAAYDCECRVGAASKTIQTKATEANTWKADVYLSIHTNAGGGRGTEVWYNPNTNGSKAFAQDIYNKIAPISPGKDRGLKSSTAYLDVKCPNMACCLCEIEFHDWIDGAKWIIESKDEIASAFVAGLVEYLGIKKKDSGDKKPATATPKAGDAVKLDKANLYSTSTTKTVANVISGTYYLWDGKNYNGRYRITNAKSRVGVAGQVTGWIDAADVKASLAVETVAAPKEKTHTVKKGESWWSIAAKEMGSGLKMNALAKYNGKTIFSVIHAGQVLKIPN